MTAIAEKTLEIPVGVVLRRKPGVTRWAKWVWTAVDVIPGVAKGEWRILRRDGDVTDYLAASVPMVLHSTETEAYIHALEAEVPGLYVVMRPTELDDFPWRVDFVTASAHDGLDYMDSGEELVENVPMPPAILALVHDFVEQHHKSAPFVKRKRDKMKVDRVDDGKGDARIRQTSDVFRAPGARLNWEPAE